MEECGHRRSARLSALDTCKGRAATSSVGPDTDPREVGGAKRGEKRAKDVLETGSGQGLPGKKRGRKRKRLVEVEKTTVNSVKEETGKAGQNSEHDDSSSYNIDKSSSGVSWLPEKRVLERILDILQKKDIHEIFAEPVKPEEVEGYYEIIRKPMDFGTMRAKLQEGLYKTLEQFEEDVFLICNNAMHFNSSGSLFFRQARSIHELAKKVFHAFKTNPDNFEAELSSMRRRRGRAPKNDVNGRGREATSAENATVDISTTGRRRSMNGQSGNRRNLLESSTFRGPSPNVDRQSAYEHLSGSKDGRKSNFSEEERRDTYGLSPFSSINDSIFSTTRNSPLIYVNQGNFNYTDSLMRFASDLGPTAQMVARRKLQRCQNLAKNHQTPERLDLQGPIVANGGDNFPARHTPLETGSGHPAPPANAAAHRNHACSGIRETCHWNQRFDVPSCSYRPAHTGVSNDSREAAIMGTGHCNQRIDDPSCFYLPAAADVGNSNDLHRAVRESGRWNPSSNVQPSTYVPAANTGNLNDMCSNLRETGRWHPGSDVPSSYLPVANTGNSIDGRGAVNEIGRWNPSSDIPSHSYMPPALDTGSATRERGRWNPSSDTPPYSYLAASASADIGNLNFPASRIENSGNDYVGTHVRDFWNNPTAKGGNSHTDCMATYTGNSYFPAATARISNSSSDYMATHVRNANFPAAAIPNSGNEFMTMMAASGIPGSGFPPIEPSLDFSQSRLLELVLRNNNNLALSGLPMPFQPTKTPTPSQAANHMQDLNLLSLSVENQAGAAALKLAEDGISSAPATAAAAQSSAWGEFRWQANTPTQVNDHAHGLNLFSMDGENQTVGAPGLSHDSLVSASTVGQCSALGQPESWGGPQTVLDMPFLQSRLGEMNLWGRNELLRPELPPTPPAFAAQETQFFDAMGGGERAPSHGHRAEPSPLALFDNQHPDLALQL